VDPPVIAPGAESVGHAQILNAFSKPFELAGLFGAADAGAFGDGSGDIAVDADEDGDVFWDAIEGDPMDEDGKQELEPQIGQKRPWSPSLAPTVDLSNAPMISADALQPNHVRQPKRQRKMKEVPGYNALPDQHVLKQMERSNPLSRKVLKKEAKRARKLHRIRTEPGTGSMEVDEDGLQFTFMV